MINGRLGGKPRGQSTHGVEVSLEQFKSELIGVVKRGVSFNTVGQQAALGGPELRCRGLRITVYQRPA